MQQNVNDEDEPQPEQLDNNIHVVHTVDHESIGQPKEHTVDETKNKVDKRFNYSRDNISINNNNNNNNLNVSKAYTTALPCDSIYKNFDIQNLTYSLMKDYSQLRISKEENFMERMKFDIYKRQIKEERINKLVEQNKLKINEEERIKAFNRLIEDANRRIEAQDNLQMMKNKIEEDLITKPTKKYNEGEWNEIYNERFKKFQEDVNRKNEEKIKQKREEERIKEDKEVELCKVKKASKDIIDKSTKRLYEESIKRRLKAEAKLSKVNYDNSPSKYKKTIQSDYNFMSDNEDECRNSNSNNNVGRSLKGGQKMQSKNKKISVTEFNNKRFDLGNKINQQQQQLPHNNINNSNKQSNVNNKGIINNNNSNKHKVGLTQEQHNYINKHLDDDENEEEERQVPQPTMSMNNDWGLNEYNNSNSNNNKHLEIAAMNRLANSNVEQGNSNLNYVNINYKQQFPYGGLSMNESEASKIVDHFFTQNLNNK